MVSAGTACLCSMWPTVLAPACSCSRLAGLEDTQQKGHFLPRPRAWSWHSFPSTEFSGPKLVVRPAPIQGMVYTFAADTITKYYRLRQQKFISSQFWRMEVQDQDRCYLRPLSDVLCPHMVFPVCVWCLQYLPVCVDLLLGGHQSNAIRVPP